MFTRTGYTYIYKKQHNNVWKQTPGDHGNIETIKKINYNIMTTQFKNGENNVNYPSSCKEQNQRGYVTLINTVRFKGEYAPQRGLFRV